jgi:hypothetical protein
MNDEPTREEAAQFYLGVADDLAVAARLLSALHAKDREAVHAITVEIVESKRGMEITYALALQSLHWAHALVPDEDVLGRQLDALALHNLDAAEVLGQAWRDQQDPPK